MGSSKHAAIILAAGQGTRMKSELPKVLHEIGGMPLVGYPIELAIDAGADPIVLVVGHKAELVRKSCGELFGNRIKFALQAEQRGTGHAVIQALPDLQGFSGNVLILYGDVPLLRRETIQRLLETIEREKNVLVAVTMKLSDPTGYGRIVRDVAGKVQRVVEHKDADEKLRAIQEVNAGIYVVDADFLRGALASLKNDNAQGEYYLTDVVERAAQDPRGAGAIIVEDPNEVLGANDRAQLAELDQLLRKRINDRWMKEGVSIVDPSTTYIGPKVTIGRDTKIQPGVHLRGKTTIGSSCSIDVGSILTGSTVHDGVEIRAYTVLEDAVVHPKAIIGPFSRLRPGAEVLEEAHVGNFVELKKTRLGKGAKANHLAYLGDAVIGPGSNIGAGTITCNYDGYGKYVTDIGKEVFVGSNATLVAPLRIGDGAYVAAGSTLTDEVEADSLAFGRARQIQKTGRAPQLREEASRRAKDAKKKG